MSVLNRSKLRKSLAIGFAAAIGAMTAAPATAYEPGWYFGAGGYYNSLEDSNGTSRVSETELIPGGSTSNPCPAASIPVLGGILNGLVGLLGVEEGCLLLLLGPGSTTTNPDGTKVTEFAAQPTFMRFDGGFGVNASVGYLFEGGFRPELALYYSENDLSGASQRAVDGSIVGLANSGKMRSNRILANLWYDLDFGGPVVPYIGIGGGFQSAKLDLDGLSDSNSGPVFQAGAGVGFLINDKTTLSLDYRYVTGDDFEHNNSAVNGNVRRDTQLKSEYAAQNIGIGIRYAFGENGGKDSDGDGVPDRKDKCPNTPKGVQVYSDGCPVDVDGDGVPDYLDKCPNTPRGAKVNARGCELDSDGDRVPDSRDQCPDTPRGVKVDARGCPIDSDGDGVPDYLDKCPDTPRGTVVTADGCPANDADGDGIPDHLDKCADTPAGVAVGPDGCPIDSDGDGIPDYLDECPKSPAGAKVLPNGCALKGDCRRPRPGEQVDANGCAADQNFILRGVKFEFDSDRLTPAAREILNDVAGTLQAYPDVSVELEGHTDNIGSDSYNLGLSERRSNVVKTYLAGRGIQGKRMTPVGYGASRPIESNASETGREENRRVELKVVE
jgi:OOP family OmpA-OmpF porin